MSEVMQIGALSMQVNRKSIKNLHISVMPPDGLVRVSAPEQMSDTAIRMAVVSRIPWIKKQQREFENQPRQSKREFLNGETHYLWGHRYRLKLKVSTNDYKVRIAGKASINLFVGPSASFEQKEDLLNGFYREVLQLQAERLSERWLPKVGVNPSNVGIRRMKTKWGSCNTDSRRIWLNLELVKKPIECLEFILVHELVHLLERHHNDRFLEHMDRLLPDWRSRRQLLNSLPLAHEHWLY